MDDAAALLGASGPDVGRKQPQRTAAVGQASLPDICSDEVGLLRACLAAEIATLLEEPSGHDGARRVSAASEARPGPWSGDEEGVSQ